MDVNNSSSGNTEKILPPAATSSKRDATPSKREKHSPPSTLTSLPPEFSLPPSSSQGTLKDIKATRQSTRQPGFIQKLKSGFQSLKGKQTPSSVTGPASAAHSSASPSPLPPVTMHVASSSATAPAPAAPSSATSPPPVAMHVEPSSLTVPRTNPSVIFNLVEQFAAKGGKSYLSHVERERLKGTAKSQVPTSQSQHLLMTCLVSAEVQQLIGKPLPPTEKVVLSPEEQRDQGLSSKEIEILEISNAQRLPGNLAYVIQQKDEKWAKAVNTQLNSVINYLINKRPLGDPVVVAAQCGYTELMEFFDAAGPNCPALLDFKKAEWFDIKYMLLESVTKSDDLIILEILLKASGINLKDDKARFEVSKLLSYAIKNNNPMLVKILLKASNPNDFTIVFHEMIAKKNLEMVKAFIEAGIDLKYDGDTPLDSAVQHMVYDNDNNMSIVRALLEAGASVDDKVARIAIGFTLDLIYHSRNFNEIIIEEALDMLEFVLKSARGEGSLSSDVQKWIQRELIQTVNVLITASKHDPNFEHPFSLVFKRMVQIFLDSGADPNVVNESSESAMSIAQGNEKVLEILCKKQ